MLAKDARRVAVLAEEMTAERKRWVRAGGMDRERLMRSRGVAWRWGLVQQRAKGKVSRCT